MKQSYTSGPVDSKGALSSEGALSDNDKVNQEVGAEPSSNCVHLDSPDPGEDHAHINKTGPWLPLLSQKLTVKNLFADKKPMERFGPKREQS